MTSTDIRAALAKRWPADQFVVVEEAPETSARAGRKIDLLVMSCWRSRGYDIDAVEIKVSMTDWKRELDNPHKADFWWNHSDRFWVAVPAELAPKVAPSLPASWGLLSVTDKGVANVYKQAPKVKAEPLSWPAMVGLIRAAQDCSATVLQRVRSDAREEGRQAGRREIERETGDAYVRDQLEVLRAKVEAFKDASGVDLVKGAYDAQSAKAMGEMYALARRAYYQPDQVLTGLARASTSIRALADSVDKVRKDITGVLHHEDVYPG